MIRYTLFTAILLLAYSCQPEAQQADAYGNFEARETTVAAEQPGRLLFLNAKEGETLKAGELIGLTDTSALHLQRQQLKARIQAVRGKTRDAEPQVSVLLEKKDHALREVRRVQALLAANAATTKQLDDLEAQIKLIDREVGALRAQNQTANQGILSEIAPLEAQLDIIDDQIRRCYLYNPVDGTVLLQLAEPFEFAPAGRPLYTIAYLGELELRAYLSGEQLAEASLGQKVKVGVDGGGDSLIYFDGQISWIAAEAEFTPKTVQTREERINLVYAFKVKVPNDGRLKAGMPGEVYWAPTTSEQ